MPTKEEILKSEYSKLIVNSDDIYKTCPSIIEAAHSGMSVFAKQDSIAFINWAASEGWQFDKQVTDGRFYWSNRNGSDIKYIDSTEELYELYTISNPQ